jgi:cytidylate kinase
MPVITISASYGAGGSWVGPEVARSLACRFIDRAIPTQVSERLAVPLEHALAHDEAATKPALGRLLVGLAAHSGVRIPELTDSAFRHETERLIIDAAATGDMVLLGRAGALVLRDHAEALQVRLDGPEQARVRQAMRIENVDETEARRRLRESDRLRTAYVEHFYQPDPRDPGLYQLSLDSTALSLETGVELILRAAGDLRAR